MYLRAFWTFFDLSFLHLYYANTCKYICQAQAHHIVQIALMKTLVERPRLVCTILNVRISVYIMASGSDNESDNTEGFYHGSS